MNKSKKIIKETSILINLRERMNIIIKSKMEKNINHIIHSVKMKNLCKLNIQIEKRKVLINNLKKMDKMIKNIMNSKLKKLQINKLMV